MAKTAINQSHCISTHLHKSKLFPHMNPVLVSCYSHCRRSIMYQNRAYAGNISRALIQYKDDILPVYNRKSHRGDHLISTISYPMLVRWHFYIESGPWFWSNDGMSWHAYYCVSRLFDVTVALCIMTSSTGNIFHITGPLWGESTGHWWIPLTKASDMELWCFLW